MHLVGSIIRIFEGTVGHSCKLTTSPALQKNKSEQALKDNVCSLLLIVL